MAKKKKKEKPPEVNLSEHAQNPPVENPPFPIPDAYAGAPHAVVNEDLQRTGLSEGLTEKIKGIDREAIKAKAEAPPEVAPVQPMSPELGPGWKWNEQDPAAVQQQIADAEDAYRKYGDKALRDKVLEEERGITPPGPFEGEPTRDPFEVPPPPPPVEEPPQSDITPEEPPQSDATPKPSDWRKKVLAQAKKKKEEDTVGKTSVEVSGKTGKSTALGDADDNILEAIRNYNPELVEALERDALGGTKSIGEIIARAGLAMVNPDMAKTLTVGEIDTKQKAQALLAQLQQQAFLSRKADKDRAAELEGYRLRYEQSRSDEEARLKREQVKQMMQAQAKAYASLAGADPSVLEEVGPQFTLADFDGDLDAFLMGATEQMAHLQPLVANLEQDKLYNRMVAQAVSDSMEMAKSGLTSDAEEALRANLAARGLPPHKIEEAARMIQPTFDARSQQMRDAQEAATKLLQGRRIRLEEQANEMKIRLDQAREEYENEKSLNNLKLVRSSLQGTIARLEAIQDARNDELTQRDNILQMNLLYRRGEPSATSMAMLQQHDANIEAYTNMANDLIDKTETHARILMAGLGRLAFDNNVEAIMYDSLEKALDQVKGSDPVVLLATAMKPGRLPDKDEQTDKEIFWANVVRAGLAASGGSMTWIEIVNTMEEAIYSKAREQYAGYVQPLRHPTEILGSVEENRLGPEGRALYQEQGAANIQPVPNFGEETLSLIDKITRLGHEFRGPTIVDRPPPLGTEQ